LRYIKASVQHPDEILNQRLSLLRLRIAVSLLHSLGLPFGQYHQRCYLARDRKVALGKNARDARAEVPFPRAGWFAAGAADGVCGEVN